MYCVWCHREHLAEESHCFRRDCSVETEHWDHMSLLSANNIAGVSQGETICLQFHRLTPWQLQLMTALRCKSVRLLWKNTTMNVGVLCEALWALLSYNVETSAPHYRVANETAAPLMRTKTVQRLDPHFQLRFCGSNTVFANLCSCLISKHKRETLQQSWNIIVSLLIYYRPGKVLHLYL